MDIIKLGIIGLGHVAEFQIRAIQETNQIDIVAYCDFDKRKIEKFNITKNIFYDDYIEMCKYNSLDVILVSTPNRDHYNIVSKLIKIKNSNLKYILLEKPATDNFIEYQKLIQEIKKTSIKLVIAFHAFFGKDVEWFINEYKHSFKKKWGSISGFKSEFYDPYIINGVLKKNALTLQGSWLDSGINALSVIGRIINSDNLFIDEHHMIQTEYFQCIDIASTVSMYFPINDNDFAGKGVIYTNWCLNKNYKVTKLYFQNSLNEIILHHSEQKVKLLDKKRNIQILVDFSKTGIRLVNHYKDLFDNFINLYRMKKDNLDFSNDLHNLLFLPFRKL